MAATKRSAVRDQGMVVYFAKMASANGSIAALADPMASHQLSVDSVDGRVYLFAAHCSA